MNPLYVVINRVAAKLAANAVNSSYTKTFSIQSSGYTASNTDVGSIISIPSGNVYIVPSVHKPGDQFHIYNSNSTNTLTITQNTGINIHFSNTVGVTANSLTGNRLLAPRGFATMTCVAANTYVISTGSGVF